MSTSHGINDFLFLSAFLTIVGKKIKHPYEANIPLHITLRDLGGFYSTCALKNK